MDGRAIPGFFYDTEKKKYFKIQPNHVAPPNSKYSKDKVAISEQKTKKRKRLAQLHAKRLDETVQRSRILQSCHSKVTLSREHALVDFSSSQHSRSVAFASQLERNDLLEVNGCHSCGRKDLIYDFAVDSATGAIVWGLGNSERGRLEYVAVDSQHDHPHAFVLAAWNSSISSVTVTNNSRAVVGTALSPCHPGNVFIAGLTDSSMEISHNVILDAPAPTYIGLGDMETTLWTSSANPAGATDIISIGHSKGAYMINAEGRLLHPYYAGRDIRAVDWLNPITTVGGSIRGDIILWDTRTWGNSLRFRHPGPVSAIRNLGNGNQILVSGLDSMAIYDVRMTHKPASKAAARVRQSKSASASEPWLSIPSITKSPHDVLDVWPDAKLVARRDDFNVVHLHSLVDGKFVRSLGTPDGGRDRPWMRRMRFVEDKRGDVSLMTCQGAWLRHWSYGGRGDDSEEEEEEE